MPSFDITSELDWIEINNAIDQSKRELSTRFDFKGSDSRIEVSEKDKTFTLHSDDEFKLEQLTDIVVGKFAKRNVDIRLLDKQDLDKVGGNKVKQVTKLKEGITQELGKKIVKLLKDSKIKVQASIQGDEVRVTGAKKDDLQSAMALIKKDITEVPVNFGNFRD
jgi:cyclic-di-GMP-binding protein